MNQYETKFIKFKGDKPSEDYILDINKIAVVVPNKNGKGVIVYTSAVDGKGEGIEIRSGDTLDEFYDFLKENTDSK